MNTLIVFIIVVAVIVTAIAAIAWAARPRTGPTRRERDLERLVNQIREIAYNRRDTDSALSYEITDAIANFNNKELS